jgi:hypothetical protein
MSVDAGKIKLTEGRRLHWPLVWSVIVVWLIA